MTIHVTSVYTVSFCPLLMIQIPALILYSCVTDICNVPLHEYEKCMMYNTTCPTVVRSVAPLEICRLHI
jgi:hypothetical protein